MKRMTVFLAVVCGLGATIPTPAFALPQFKKAFEEHYGLKEGKLPELKAAVKTAGCNVCHVKGEQDKAVQNSYGEALNKLVEGNAKERINAAKEESKEAQKAEIATLIEEFKAALPKAEEEKNEEGETYGSRIKAGKLPVDVPLDEEERAS